jgi:Family of unknown function (DUF5681)
MRFFDDDRRSEDDDTHPVGYGSPSTLSRFRKGQSGNPSGKPGAKKTSATLFRRALLQPVLVKQGGRRRKVTKLQVVATQLVNKAMQGDYQATRLLLSHCSWLHAELTEPMRQRRGLSPEVTAAIRKALAGRLDDNGTALDSEPSGAEHATDREKPEVQTQEKEKRTGPYEVGFGKPPVQSRFRKGQSGNPAGRPPMAKTFARLVKRLLLEKVSITENGCARTAMRLQVIFEQMVNRAALGNARFLKLLLEYIPSVDIVLARNRKPPKNLVQIIYKRLYESTYPDN